MHGMVHESAASPTVSSSEENRGKWIPKLRTSRCRREIRHPRPDPALYLAHDAGVDETRHDSSGRILWNMQEVLESLEGHGALRLVNDVIHDGFYDFRASPLFASLNAHRFLHPHVCARLVPETRSGPRNRWAEVFADLKVRAATSFSSSS